MVTFPDANNQTMDDREFLAYWLAWFAGPGSQGKLPFDGPVPRLAGREVMAALISRGYGHGLDALCRTIVHAPYRNGMHATGPFMAANAHLLEATNATNPCTGKNVNGARLTPRAIDMIDAVRNDTALMTAAEARIESDVDIERPDGAFEAVDATDPLPPGNTLAHLVAPKGLAQVADRKAFVKSFVQWIEAHPYQAQYRRRAVGPEIHGWHARLNAYFWPKPTIGLTATSANMRPLLEEGQALAETIDDWNEAARQRAVDWANEVLTWGGVPQRLVTADIVRAVIRAAITREPGDAPMNSGWTKVAAFATAHLEDQGGANAIWDSRVSWSLVRRADALLHASGCNAVPEWLAGIGKVPGRGGTRWGHELHLPWPNAYGRWPSHFAAADLIRDIRDTLNDGVVPKAAGTAPWTTRSVEMVLFMDGY